MSIFKRIKTATQTRAGVYIFYVLAAAAITLLHSAKWAYGWIATSYPLGTLFVPACFAALCVCAAATLGFSFAPEKRRTSRAARVGCFIFCFLSGALFVFTVMLQFSLDQGIDPYSLKNGMAGLAPNLPFFSVAAALPFLFVLFSRYRKRTRAILALIISLAIALPVFCVGVPALRPFAFSANPLVLDIGNDQYSVVFATNRDSVAWLTYTAENGEVVQAADSGHGSLNAGRLHQFNVPREEFNGAAYTVSARELRSWMWVNVLFGGEIESPEFQFRGEYKDELNILMATDWHHYPENALAAAARLPAPDLFLMLGDYATVYNSEDELIRCVLAAGADMTKSEIPAIFVRGNHEMDGRLAGSVFPSLGLDSFYYQVRRGNVLFTICDGGNDEWDSEKISLSYGDSYRGGQLDWLESLPAPEENTLHFAAIHIPGFVDNDAAKQARFFAALERLGVGMQFSGHWHELYLALPGQDDYMEPPFPLLVAGGPAGGRFRGNYLCSMAQVTAAGTVRLTARDKAGALLMDEVLDIR
ncbi:MAG: metallophosphoesterase [Oscillospiraceae bacterium]|nr:metallophosphoesterase [Oscillospiraceae bacterium]